ncbi:MAG: T9SS type A sorting domain-containing protein, partial [Bacteroidetes bacterium]|nr:T9SS type A sorting domain-containing protein [Bacteroidota bacterium]MBU1720075.1 T9SS type A sorting domain-containing protein [Bacteroidota bacterium]
NYIAGNISLSSGSTVRYNSNIPQTISSIAHYDNLELAATSSVTKTAGGALTVNGDLDIGIFNTLDDGGYQVTGNATGTLSVASGSGLSLGSASSATSFPTNYTSENISLDPTSTVTYNSNVPQTISTVPEYGHLSLLATAPVTKSVSDGLSLAGNLTVGANNTMQCNVGSFITVGGSTTNNGSVILDCPESDAPGASWIDNGTISGSGTFTVKRYVSGTRWWYFGAPISNALSGDYDAADADIRFYYYDEPTGWVRIMDNVTSLSGTMGYGYKNTTDDAMITFTGAINTGLKSTVTAKTPGAPKPGWHLLNNPYPSAIDWDAASGWTRINLDSSFWIRKDGVYASYNGVTHIGTNGGTKEIAAMQSFWVKSVVDGGQLQMNNAVRIHSSGTLLKDMSSPVNILRLAADNGTESDETVLYFTNGASNTYEKRDTEKSFGATTVPHLYTKSSNNVKLTLDSRSPALLGSDLSIPLGFKIGIAGTYTITASEVESFDPSIEVYLEDKLLGVVQNLRTNPVYSFSSGVVDNTTRFVVRFQNNPLPVELLLFTASYLSPDVSLEWHTASECNNAGFDVERSDNGISFEKIAFVQGAGTSNVRTIYSYNDKPENRGVILYRLKQIDFDGKFEYSDVVSVQINSAENEAVRVFPNPASEYFYVGWDNTNPLNKIVITDFSGKNYLDITPSGTENSNLYQIDVKSLPSGMYIVELTGDILVERKTLVIR